MAKYIFAPDPSLTECCNTDLASEEVCDAPELISDEAAALVGVHKTTNCPVGMDAPEGSLPVASVSGVKNRTGASGDEIVLPYIEDHDGDEVAYILVQTQSGQLKRWNPTAFGVSSRTYVSWDSGDWKLADNSRDVCFDEEDVCDACEPSFLAAFCHNPATGELCLQKTTVDELISLSLSCDPCYSSIDGLGSS